MATKIVAEHQSGSEPALTIAELKKLLSDVGSMCMAIGGVAAQKPSDDSMAAALYAVQACVEKQDRLLARVDEQIEKLLMEVGHV